ncbi:MAG: cytochrome c [Bacteroidota bacterium]
MDRLIPILLILTLLISCNNTNSYTEHQEKSIEEPNPEILARLKRYKGIGPITTVELNEKIDMNMARQGEGVFIIMCTSCHKPKEDFIGPSPQRILDRRSPEWVMNMILNPEEMNKKDSLAITVYEQYNRSPMSNQFLSEDQARQILEYFRTL